MQPAVPRSAVAEWRRLRVARSLIEATLERFERERQPAVLGEEVERVVVPRTSGLRRVGSWMAVAREVRRYRDRVFCDRRGRLRALSWNPEIKG